MVDADSPDREVCGQYGLGTSNKAEERLLDFCYDNDLYITSTAFQHHVRRRYSWQSPGGRCRNQIDYILIRRRWLWCVTNSRAYPGTYCRSDYNLVGATVKLRIRRERSRTRRIRLNLAALDDPATRVAYNVEINNQFEAIGMLEGERPPEEMFTALKKVIKTIAEEVLGREPKRTNQRWISDKILQLMDRRRELKDSRATSEDGEGRYQEANRAVQREARRDKVRWLEEQSTEVEDGLYYHDMRRAYNLIKTLRKGFQPRQRNIKDEEGRVLTDLKDILRRWRDYGESLYNDNDDSHNHDNISEHGPVILESEVQEAIRRLPKNKAESYDDLPAELFKTNNQTMTQVMCKLCNKILETGEWPTGWLRSASIPIPKISRTIECVDYRIMALISHASKILLRVLLQRTQKTAEEQFADVQMGFRKVGTRNQIFNIRIIMKKVREFNVPLYMAFIDYKKAFDSVRHSVLWTVPREMGVSGSVVRLLKNLYSGQQAAVRVKNDLTEWFTIKKGVRQGCHVSPMFFNFYLEEVMRRSADEICCVGMSISGRVFNNLRFADDIVLIATSPIRLQRLLHEEDRVSSKFQLEITRKKTKVMAATREPEELNIWCRGVKLTQVDKFKYLGSIIEQTADESHEIRARLEQQDQPSSPSTSFGRTALYRRARSSGY